MRAKKAIIGISTNFLFETFGPETGQERVYVNYSYIDVVIQAGGVPLMLPFVENEEIVRAQMNQIDGLILSGGIDVNPLLYGEQPHPMLGTIFPKRDTHELHLVRMAEETNKPILGICRGLQLLNVAFGGTLYQDIPHMFNTNILHLQKEKKHIAMHDVDVMPGTILEEIFNASSLETNTYHHQAIKKLANGFTINAKAKDGLIEGIEKNDGHFILGVQWHPEMMVSSDANMQKLFNYFIKKVENHEPS
ncbi:gamma-glutamyl-gamma-aminobutyrate hydrolase family protein [Parachlamydia sp. AcF125]|uniref:gamma-glutamyl-gamma-aminobutyrate hydrolase family protein n=1 Tax=Parachlamydia sp. AcF125 TaxID=2795736 RepID=UPI001BC9445A|nr:gamma-glutamyl-gamma-aminobutyrate hydrolase family protein [Parachlamydia sp. AcF125]MBS4168359.1 putative glutamine amidotransferase [Parachlamydia sp. AcF125]